MAYTKQQLIDGAQTLLGVDPRVAALALEGQANTVELTDAQAAVAFYLTGAPATPGIAIVAQEIATSRDATSQAVASASFDPAHVADTVPVSAVALSASLALSLAKPHAGFVMLAASALADTSVPTDADTPPTIFVTAHDSGTLTFGDALDASLVLTLGLLHGAAVHDFTFAPVILAAGAHTLSVKAWGENGTDNAAATLAAATRHVSEVVLHAVLTPVG